MSGFASERPPAFACEIERSGDEVLARLSGELDMLTSDHAQKVLEAAVEGRNGDRLVLDLRDLTFMDSSGLRLLLKWDAAARADGFGVVLVRGSEEVQRVLELTGLQDHFTFVEPG